MRLVEKLVPRSYHLLDYDWTPLSQNPYWTAVLPTISTVTWENTGVSSQDSQQGAVVQILPGARNRIPNYGDDTSFVDDFVASRYCKCWEWACLTIHWDFAWVFPMCLSFAVFLRIRGYGMNSGYTWNDLPSEFRALWPVCVFSSTAIFIRNEFFANDKVRFYRNEPYRFENSFRKKSLSSWTRKQMSHSLS